jgi:hypothetical protein
MPTRIVSLAGAAVVVAEVGATVVVAVWVTVAVVVVPEAQAGISRANARMTAKGMKNFFTFTSFFLYAQFAARQNRETIDARDK